MHSDKIPVQNNKVDNLNEIKTIIENNTETILAEIKNTNNNVNGLEKQIIQLQETQLQKTQLHKQLMYQNK